MIKLRVTLVMIDIKYQLRIHQISDKILPEWLPKPEVTCLAWPRYRPFSGEVPSRLLEWQTDLGRFVEAPCPEIRNEN